MIGIAAICWAGILPWNRFHSGDLTPHFAGLCFAIAAFGALALWYAATDPDEPPAEADEDLSRDQRLSLMTAFGSLFGVFGTLILILRTLTAFGNEKPTAWLLLLGTIVSAIITRRLFRLTRDLMSRAV